MTPIGLVMSYVAFVAKDPKGGVRHMFSPFAAGVVVVAALIWLGMTALATTIDSEGHTHGEDAATEAPVEAPAEAPADGRPVDGGPSGGPAEPTDDGHSSHSHCPTRPADGPARAISGPARSSGPRATRGPVCRDT